MCDFSVLFPLIPDYCQLHSCVDPVQATTAGNIVTVVVLSSSENDVLQPFSSPSEFYILPNPSPECSLSLKEYGITVLFRAEQSTVTCCQYRKQP